MYTGFHFEEGMYFITVEGRDIPVILAVMAAALALEIFLALKRDGRLGLVLPGLWLLQSAVKLIVWMVLVGAYSSVPDRGGELCMAFFIENIPTLLLLGVYGLCRLSKGWKTRRQVEQTRIEDI